MTQIILLLDSEEIIDNKMLDALSKANVEMQGSPIKINMPLSDFYPLTYEAQQARIEDSLALQLRQSMELNAKLKNNMSVFEKEVWNKAIDAAVEVIRTDVHSPTSVMMKIRSLKK